MLDVARNHVSELVERVKAEIASVSEELCKALDDSVYTGMTARQEEIYAEKRKKLKSLVQEFSRLIELQRQPSDAHNDIGNSPAASLDTSLPNPLKPPKDAA